MADAVLIGSNGDFFVQNSSGKFNASIVATNSAGLAFLKIGTAVNGTDQLAFTLPTIGDLSKMKIGQKVIILGTTISSFIYEGDSEIKISLLKSNAGGMVLNLDGEALGVALFNETTPFASLNTITEALKEVAQ